VAGQTLSGLVVVVAGEAPQLVPITQACIAAGASVAVVSRTLPDIEVTLRFRADPAAPQTWDRVAMHVEQHLGPVDGVATDEASYDAVHATFAGDLTRRGHGRVVVVTPDTGASSTISSMVGKP